MLTKRSLSLVSPYGPSASLDDQRGWEPWVALHLLSALSAGGCVTRAASSSKRLWECDAAVAQQREMLRPKESAPWGGYIQVCVCVCVCIWKNINNISISTFGWWQMVLMVIIIMHNFLLSVFLLTIAVKWTSNCFCLCLPSCKQLGGTLHFSYYWKENTSELG